MKTLFHLSLYQFDQVQPSYWEATAGSSKLKSETLSGTQSCDVAIIRGRLPKFPLAFSRRQYVRAGLSFYSLRDRFNF